MLFTSWNPSEVTNSVVDLISFYEANPLLLNLSCQEYRNREKKCLKETEIAGILERTDTLYCGKIAGVLLYTESV